MTVREQTGMIAIFEQQQKNRLFKKMYTQKVTK